MRTPTHVAAFVLALGTVAAQHSFVVDHRGGAGVDFTDLPPALAVAVAGDTITVRSHANPYACGTIRRGITLAADTSVAPGRPPTLAGTGMVIDGVPAGEAVVLRGFECSNGTSTGLVVRNCQGRIQLDGITCSGFANPGIVVQQGVTVTLRACSLRGAPAIHVTTSRIALDSCDLIGRPYDIFTPNLPPLPALTADAAIVTVSSGVWQGGGASFVPPVPSAPAILASNGSALEIRGDASTLMTSGVSAVPPSGIVVHGSSLVLDPAVRVSGPPSGTGTITLQRLPLLRLGNTSVGVPLGLTLSSPAGDTVAALIGLPSPALVLPPLGVLWLDPFAPLVVIASVQGASGAWAVPLPVLPNAMRGATLAVQGLSGPGTDLHFTNPIVFVVR